MADVQIARPVNAANIQPTNIPSAYAAASGASQAGVGPSGIGAGPGAAAIGGAAPVGAGYGRRGFVPGAVAGAGVGAATGAAAAYALHPKTAATAGMLTGPVYHLSQLIPAALFALGTIPLLVGAALYVSDPTDISGNVYGAAICFLIGFPIWTIAAFTWFLFNSLAPIKGGFIARNALWYLGTTLLPGLLFLAGTILLVAGAATFGPGVFGIRSSVLSGFPVSAGHFALLANGAACWVAGFSVLFAGAVLRWIRDLYLLSRRPYMPAKAFGPRLFGYVFGSTLESLGWLLALAGSAVALAAYASTAFGTLFTAAPLVEQQIGYGLLVSGFSLFLAGNILQMLSGTNFLGLGLLARGPAKVHAIPAGAAIAGPVGMA